MKPMTFGLMIRHQKLDEELRLEQARKFPDASRISKLKKLKLAVKDRLHRLSLGRQMQSMQPVA